mmetsp:Transcript_137941/g.384721  ORF Transcript_137941/g.384721 Transcript_137941/m.384721 type:complete len:278 (-) Transcript_137941:1491-2324(-)
MQAEGDVQFWPRLPCGRLSATAGLAASVQTLVILLDLSWACGLGAFLILTEKELVRRLPRWAYAGGQGNDRGADVLELRIVPVHFLQVVHQVLLGDVQTLASLRPLARSMRSGWSQRRGRCRSADGGPHRGGRRSPGRGRPLLLVPGPLPAVPPPEELGVRRPDLPRVRHVLALFLLRNEGLVVAHDRAALQLGGDGLEHGPEGRVSVQERRVGAHAPLVRAAEGLPHAGQLPAAVHVVRVQREEIGASAVVRRGQRPRAAVGAQLRCPPDGLGGGP